MGLTKANAMRKKALVADDNVFVRSALGEFFEREPDLQVCAMSENGREAIEEASPLHPDLIVLDLSMPVMNGLDGGAFSERGNAGSPTDYVLFHAIRNALRHQ